jgi:vacuolar-type H+-ATPase subunit E/Vma4
VSEMGLEKVLERIETDSRADDQRLQAKAREDAQALLAEAKAKRELTLTSYRAKAGEEVSLLRAREAARTEVEAKKALLACKKAVLDEAFGAVLETLKHLPASETRRYYASLLARLGPEFAGGVIRCRKGDEGHFAGAKGMTVRGDLDAAGGFVAESRDGTLAADMRFESLLAAAWERRIAYASGMLFSKG